MEPRSNILIVDDKPQNLYALEKLLQRLDVDVFQATSGNEALGLTVEHEFCVAIVDVQMPDMDGYELVELLRGNQATATLPVIFVSAIFSDEYHHRKGYEAGAVDFLSKPFVPEILLSKVQVFMQLDRQRQELQRSATRNADLYAQILRFNEELEHRVQQRTAELEKAYHELELLDRQKSDFIHVAAHELRTPLTLIRGYSDMMGDDPEIQAQDHWRRQVAGIASGASRMHEIVDNMVDVARIDSGTLTINPQRTMVLRLFESLLNELAVPLTARRLEIEVEPSLEALPLIEADPIALRKLFGHLMSNAIKYTPDGGRVTVSGSCVDSGPGSPSEQFIEIVVTDTGIGIDPEFHEMIFAKFYRTGQVAFHSSGKTKFKGGGPGLGLTIARGVAEAHGGHIWVESPGHDEVNCPGSRFHVILPVEQKRTIPNIASAEA